MFYCNVFVSEVCAAVETVTDEVIVETVVHLSQLHVQVYAAAGTVVICRLIPVGDHRAVKCLVEELRRAA